MAIGNVVTSFGGDQKVSNVVVDRVGGVLLGTAVGLVISSAIIIVLVRATFDFSIETPGSDIYPTPPSIVSVQSQRDDLLNSLGDSIAVTLFLNIRPLLPETLTDLLPDELGIGIELLDLFTD